MTPPAIGPALLFETAADAATEVEDGGRVCVSVCTWGMSLAMAGNLDTMVREDEALFTRDAASDVDALSGGSEGFEGADDGGGSGLGSDDPS